MKNDDLVNQMVAFCENVMADAVQCLEELSKSPSDFWTRMTIRASASCIEGIATVLADSAIHNLHSAEKSKGLSIDDANKLMVLTTQAPDITDTGIYKSKKWLPRSVPYVLFCFRCNFLLVGIDEETIKNNLLNSECQKILYKLFDTRNRITHPKMASSIYVTIDDKNVVIKAMATIIRLLHVLNGTKPIKELV